MRRSLNIFLVRVHSKDHNRVIQIGQFFQFFQLYLLIYQKEKKDKEHFLSPDPGYCSYLLFLKTLSWIHGSGHHKLAVNGYNSAVDGSPGPVEHMVSLNCHDDPMNTS